MSKPIVALKRLLISPRGQWFALFVYAVAAGAIAFRLAPFFKPGATTGIFPDNTFLFSPIFHYLNETISSGFLPLWIKGLLGGIPFYNTPQLSYFYPFYFFWVEGLYATPVQAAHVQTALTVAHLIVMTITMTVFLRVLSLSKPAAIFGAMMLSLSACIGTYIFHVTIMASISWCPLLLAGIHLCLTGRRATGIATAVAGGSLVALASPTQTLIHAVILAVVHVLAVIVPLARNNGWRSLRLPAASLAAAAAITLAIVAPNLITAFFNPFEIRWISGGSMIGRGAVPYASFLDGQLTVRDLVGVVSFRELGTGNNFIGVTALICVLAALADRARRSLVITYSALGIYFLLSSTGDNLGFSLLNYRIPLLNMIRQPDRNLYLFVFSAAVLAAVGFDRLVVFFSRFVRTRIVIGCLFPLVVLSWVSQQPTYQVPTDQQSDYLDPQNLRMQSALRFIAARPNGVGAKVRLLADGPTEAGIERMQFSMGALWHGLRSFYSWLNPLPDHRAFEQFTDFNNRPAQFYRDLGVQFIICTKCDGVDDLTPIGEAAGYRIFEDTKAAPSYRVTGDCVAAPDQRSHNVLTFAISCNSPGTLHVNELYATQWRATINGAVVPVSNDAGTMSVALATGANVIKYSYAPHLYMALLLVSLLGVLAWVATLAVAMTRLSRRSMPEQKCR